MELNQADVKLYNGLSLSYVKQPPLFLIYYGS